MIRRCESIQPLSGQEAGGQGKTARLSGALPILALAIGAAFVLAACLGQGSASQTIEKYLNARVQNNVNQMIVLSCPDWEAQARIEASTFEAMQVRLEGLACQDSGTDGSVTLVSCQGKIVTTYNGEARDWSLADRKFKAVLDGGEWRMCGYE